MKHLTKLFAFSCFLVSTMMSPSAVAQPPLVDCVVYVGGGYSGDYFTNPFFGTSAQMYGGAMKTWPAFGHADQQTGGRCNFITRYSRSGATAAQAQLQLEQAVIERDALLEVFQPPSTTRYFYILDPTTAGEWLFSFDPLYNDEGCMGAVDDWAMILRNIYDEAVGAGFTVVVLDVPLWDSLNLAASGFGIPASEACYDYAVSAFLDQFHDVPLLEVWGVPKNAVGNPEWTAFDGVHPPAKAQKRASRRIGERLKDLLEN